MLEAEHFAASYVSSAADEDGPPASRLLNKVGDGIEYCREVWPVYPLRQTGAADYIRRDRTGRI
jgi:hypothetical protein